MCVCVHNTLNVHHISRDYEVLKEKKATLQKEKDRLYQECGQLRKQVHGHLCVRLYIA